MKTAALKGKTYTGLLDKSLKIFFSTAWRITLRRPSQAYFFFRTVQWQRKAVKVRAALKQQCAHVPPIIIYSITERCNLHCKGCYAVALHDAVRPEMSDAKMRETIREARELGVSFMVLAGGEPLVRREILDIIQEFKDVIFFVFTNGTLIDNALADRMKRRRVMDAPGVVKLSPGRPEIPGGRHAGSNLQKINASSIKQKSSSKVLPITVNPPNPGSCHAIRLSHDTLTDFLYHNLLYLTYLVRKHYKYRYFNS